MRLEEANRDFVQHIRHIRKLADFTCEHYQSRLGHLHRWLVANGYPEPTVEDLTPPVLRRFIYGLSTRGLRPRSIRAVFVAVKCLCNYLTDELKVFSVNPAKGLAMPKLDEPDRKPVTDEELQLLFEACERRRLPRRVAYSRAVLAVLAFTGLRRSEVCDLKLEDVDLREKKLTVRRGKGGKSRVVYLCDACVDALHAYLALRGDCTHDYLFAANRAQRMHFEGMASLLEDLKAIAGLADRKHIKPHSVRHGYASRLVRNGVDIRTVQALLGHSSLRTTAQYLHTNETQLQNAAQAAALHPQNSTPPRVDDSATAEPAPEDTKRTSRPPVGRARFCRSVPRE